MNYVSIQSRIYFKRYLANQDHQNPDPQVNRVSGDENTHPQEKQTLPDRLPQSLIEWLARVNRRYLALSLETANDTSKILPWLLLDLRCA
jgi:hypothetical protein